jgi:hypothetical protein
MFTQIEKDRLTEILFYLYFDKKDETVLENANFWHCINDLCKVYNVDSLQVSRAARILFADENKPTEFETWYLLHKLGVSVRPIRKLSGVYWQKQKQFNDEVELKGVKPTIKRCITDAAMKKNIKDFIVAILDMFGTLSVIEGKFLDAFFDL